METRIQGGSKFHETGREVRMPMRNNNRTQKIIRQNTGSPGIQKFGLSPNQDSEKALPVPDLSVESCFYVNPSIRIPAHSGLN